jgi:hypothetical protein
MTDTTYQFRRYQLRPGDLPAFVTWWRETMRPTREAYGFTVEFGYAVPERSEFIWAVSLPVGEEEFRRRDAAWNTSPERLAALESAPRLVAQRVNLADKEW